MVTDIMAFICDITVTLELCYLLHRGRSNVKATDGLINRILVSILNRGGTNLIINILLLVLVRRHKLTRIHGRSSDRSLSIAESISQDNAFVSPDNYLSSPRNRLIHS